MQEQGVISLAPDDLRVAQYLHGRLVPRLTKYIPQIPTPKQQLALCLNDSELLFGGAGGGGKSSYLLMAALQYVDVPGYAALILRRTYTDLCMPGALLDRAHDWLRGTDARWIHDLKGYVFPSGARLCFGHLDIEKDKKRYDSTEWMTICFDELTAFTETQFKYLHTRLRRPLGSQIPLRLRGATNPGNDGHEWVKRHFGIGLPDRAGYPPFIPARLEDNPHIDQESYRNGLMHTDAVTRERILNGDWTATEGGEMFARQNWVYIDATPRLVVARARGWDLAATAGEDAKETVGTKMAVTWEGLYVVEHVVWGKWLPGERDKVIASTAAADGKGTRIIIEEEGGSGGIAQSHALVKMLAGYDVIPQKVTGDKFVRAGAYAAQAGIKNVALLRGAPWVETYIDRLFASRVGAKLLDFMDSSSLVFNWLAENARIPEPPRVGAPKPTTRPPEFRDAYPPRPENPFA